MFRFKSLLRSLAVWFGIIAILSISPVSAIASEKPEIFVQLGHTDFGIPGSKAVLSHTGKYLSSAGNSGAIKLWEVETGREIKTLLGHSVNLTLLAFSHDDRYLLSGSVDKTIKLWDVSAGKEIRTFTGHKDFVSYGAFSPDGKTAATSDRKEIKLWDIKTGREIKSSQGNEHFGKDFTSIYSMIFSPDGKYLVSVGNGGRIVAWEVSSGARIVQIDRGELFSGNIDNFLRFSSDGKVIISGMERIIFVDLFAKKAKIIPIKSPLIDVSQDEKYVLCKPVGGTLFELFDLNTGKKVWDLQSPSVLFEASFSPDNKFVLLYGSDNILKLYDRATGNELRSFKSDVESPGSVAFSKDGKYAVVGSSVVKLWNLHKGGFDGVININKQYEQILSMLKEVEKSKDQEVAKKAEKLSEEIDYYSYTSGTIFHDKNNNKFYSVDSPYGTNTIIFYEVPRDCKLGGIDLANRREINKFSAHTAEITTHALSDKYALTGSKDKTIKLFEFPSGRYIRTFTGHLGEIKGLTFSPDGEYILSASNDGTTRLWDISTGKEIAQFISFKDGEWVIITPEGYFNASPNGAKHLNVRVGNNVYSVDNFYEKFFNPVYVASVSSVLQGKKVEAVADLSAADAQIIPEEAKRHFDRGMAAVEMAKSPADYESAIKEFTQAARLAPCWPDVYYNLGMVQEKAGKYSDAVTNLQQYLRLAPNASDAATVKSLINKLEFKAEQVITDEEALDIFVSLTDSNQWQLNGITNANLFDRDRNPGWVKWFRRSSEPGRQNRLDFEFFSMSCCPTLRGVCPGSALPMGKVVEFQTFYCLSEGITSVYDYRLEVVSRNKVKMFLKVWSKHKKGSTSEASYEFVRR